VGVVVVVADVRAVECRGEEAVGFLAVRRPVAQAQR